MILLTIKIIVAWFLIGFVVAVLFGKMCKQGRGE